jgi:superfamily II DNA or RNA helicase
VKNKFLTPPLVFSSAAALEFAKQKFKIVNNEFDLKAQTAVLGQKKIVQDTVDCYRKFFNGAPCIIFCASSQDMKVVDEAMKNAGWNGGIVKFGMDPNLRRDYISGLGTGKYNYLCSYEVIGEGVDIPVLAGVILRRLTKSLVNYLQWVGRALRTYPGKKHGLVIDQAGNYYLHGHPLEHRRWSLKGKTIRRKEDEIKSKECPNPLCRAFITDNPSVCPYCGMNLMNSGTAACEDKELRIVNAELLEIHSPVYHENQPVVENHEDALLKEIVNNTFQEIEKSKNTMESRLDFLMDNIKKSQVNKTWRKYGTTSR